MIPAPDPTPRVALVTGGTRGIGAAVSRALRDAGRRVVATYGTNVEQARHFEAETGIRAVAFDVADLEACADALARIAERDGPVTILVNNAGITRDSTIGRMTRAAWDDVIDTNLGGAFNLCHLAMPAMRAQGFGRIVNMASINGQTGQFGQANYAASKAGLQGLTRALALEGARHNITVNTVAPGYIDTAMLETVPPHILTGIIDRIPVGRLGTPEDVARAVTFLTADEAGFITGSTLSVNGGQHMP
ncbi:acetoacetyl-CoA reductase [Gluconacetobacter diazotrophicus PA1 5]|uniref:3-oxoacyl-ACP reductase n=2 Tax=Gluconacetobacter diazotrophicus TaxID=33996 RepID=A0A7W4FD43_GLUDI|nr:3-oxoacyl-ACP reductase [Gluconacetobacter diazotrophicus]ACI52795.1 acetoacetyl-CoA reductase [Gluconacetobacter diazotrophicus PA1 5]MBB2155467.1 3-oxoacyl-ACP reductase [Gluconacetobacter diazotrophicus]TWB09060.1 3-oxoacyl-[acyl-carrier-protein] reductase /acetoacetyl-CoA reductase [Gluconacetobacter diazotrophicus]